MFDIKDYSKLQAAAIVTKEIGHERIDVIDVYFGGETVISPKDFQIKSLGRIFI